eukprot:XP_015582040.1 uncharacterized protein LOC107262200 [Ricinus communis]
MGPPFEHESISSFASSNIFKAAESHQLKPLSVSLSVCFLPSSLISIFISKVMEIPGRAFRRKRASSLDIMSSKRAPRDYYKGKNCKPTGFHNHKGSIFLISFNCKYHFN